MADRRVLVQSLIVALSLAALVGGAAPGIAAAIEPSDSENRLDHPISDVVVLPPDGADGAPRILTIEAIDSEPGIRAVRMLEREVAWNLVADARFDLTDAEILRVEEPWFVDLGEGTVAIIATSHWQDRSVIELIRASGPTGIDIVARQTLERAIDAAGAADVDGDGTAELVVASEAVACSGTIVQAMDAVGLTLRDPVSVPFVMRRGVIGRFDDVAGDDLMAYASETCPGVQGGASAHLITTRLSDGVISGDVPAIDGGLFLRPMRVDLDRDGRHEAFAQAADGVMLVDPTTATVHAGLTPADVSLLSATEFGSGEGARVRLHVFNGARGSDPVEIRTVGMNEGRRPIGLDVVPAPGMEPPAERTRLIFTGIGESAGLGIDPVAWAADLGGSGCTALFVPGTLVPCADSEVRPGPAWIATRPLTVVDEGSDARILVASGIGWPAEGGLPTTPSPWAGGADGRWRWGPSTPFTLAELRAGDATYFQQFPIPRSTLERTTSPDATIDVPGFTGVRTFVRAVAGSSFSEVPMREALTAPASTFEQRSVHRINVPPGLDSGRDGSSVVVALADVLTAYGQRADRWTVTVVPINDWGEVGPPARGEITRDAIGPTLSLEAPFTSAVWPLPASVAGITEPGVEVVVDGVGPVELDRRGNFTVTTPLAPWPQTLTATATDASGNATVRTVSVIGGIDYRRLPWGTIGAILVIAAVTVSGFLGSRRGALRGGSVAAVGVGAGGWDDVGAPEIEELPPGQGLPSV